MTRAGIDALFVINQDASADAIGQACRRQGLKSVLVLSTQHLFEDERQTLLGLAGVERVVFREFGGLLTDTEMQWCDDEATRLLSDSGPAEFSASYAELHMARSRRLKNSLIQRVISREYTVPFVFYSPGIGVDEEPWASLDASAELPCVRRLSKSQRLMRKLARVARRPEATAAVILDTERKRLFMLADTSRLHARLPDGARTVQVPRSSRPTDAWRQLLDSHGAADRPNVVCTTIHQYDPRLSSLGCPIEIFVDGYQPSNYPRTYLDGYVEGTFVVHDMFDAAWFEKHGKSTLKPYAFLRPVMMKAPVELPHGIRSIYLMLNHAGDWSALINRSDTDIAVERFVQIARDHREVKMVVRCHPTMARKEHEGEGSLERIKRYVEAAGLPNLRLSAASLAEDMDDADVIVSEYSNVILDGFRAGTLGLIANCTSRRNFLQDYTDLGFATAPAAADLQPLIRDVVANSRAYLERQKLAATRYNERLEQFLRD